MLRTHPADTERVNYTRAYLLSAAYALAYVALAVLQYAFD